MAPSPTTPTPTRSGPIRELVFCDVLLFCAVWLLLFAMNRHQNRQTTQKPGVGYQVNWVTAPPSTCSTASGNDANASSV